MSTLLTIVQSIFLNERLTGCFFKFPSFFNWFFHVYIVVADTLKIFLVCANVCPSCQYSQVLFLYFSSYAIILYYTFFKFFSYTIRREEPGSLCYDLIRQTELTIKGQWYFLRMFSTLKATAFTLACNEIFAKLGLDFDEISEHQYHSSKKLKRSIIKATADITRHFLSIIGISKGSK